MATTIQRLWWISEDGQSSDDCGVLGDFGTTDTEAHERAAMDAMILQCATESERDSIRSGSMVWRTEDLPFYAWSTSTASGEIQAADAKAALQHLVDEGVWAGGTSDGGWIWIRSDQVGDEIQIGEMP